MTNQYPMPLIGKSHDRSEFAKQFTYLDLKNIYHRIQFRKGDRWKTAFRFRYGYFEYKFIFFSLSNGPASFLGYINETLVRKLDKFIIVYIHNILI